MCVYVYVFGCVCMNVYVCMCVGVYSALQLVPPSSFVPLLQGADRAAEGQCGDQDSGPGGCPECPAEHQGGAEGHLGAAEAGGNAGEEHSADAGEGRGLVIWRGEAW